MINLLTKVVRAVIFIAFFLLYHQNLSRAMKRVILFQLLDVLETHPDFYVQFIQSSLHLAVTYNFTDSGTGKTSCVHSFESQTLGCPSVTCGVDQCLFTLCVCFDRFAV